MLSVCFSLISFESRYLVCAHVIVPNVRAQCPVRLPFKTEVQTTHPGAKICTISQIENRIKNRIFAAQEPEAVKYRSILLMLVLATLSSCGVIRWRSSPMYLAGSPAEEGYEPKGSVEEVVCPSRAPGPASRRMIVYLPPGYERDTLRRYPVLYLLHGARGHETAWVRKGHVFRTADSLIALGAAVPCIIVTPNMNQYNDSTDMEASRRKELFEALFEIDGSVETAFMGDVVDFTDSRYRTIPDKAHRAIAGASIGGLQSIHISANHPDAFGYVGAFSPLWRVMTRRGDDNRFYRGIKRKMAVQFATTPPPVYYIMTGRSDPLYPHITHLRRYLDKKGYPYRYVPTPGGHNWKNWSLYLALFLQELFREREAGRQ